MTTMDGGLLKTLSVMAATAIVAISAVFFVAPQPVYGAFGISPPFLNADHLVKGARYVQTIYLVQDKPDQDLPILAALDISERVQPWISIDRGSEFVIPRGTKQFPVQITVDVPKDAELGVYIGTHSFTGQPASAGQVTIALGAQVAINLSVGTGIFRKLLVPLVQLVDIEEGWSPRVLVKINNEGNIPESFTGATYELLDQFGSTRLALVQKGKDFPEVPPFTIEEHVIEFPVDFHLGVGQFWGNVKFFQNEKVVASQRTVFNVLKRGSLSSPTARLIKSFTEQWLYYIGGLALLVIIIGAFVRIRRRVR